MTPACHGTGRSPLAAQGSHHKRSVLSVDVGGTFMKSAILAPSGALSHLEQTPTNPAAGPQAVLATLRRVIERGVELADIGAVGVTATGIVDSAAGIVRFSANLGWRNLPLKQEIESWLTPSRIKVVVDHDVRCGALAEARVGAGTGFREFLFLPIGTGISGAIVRGGVVDDHHPLVGELGHHVVVRRGGRPCPCGGSGCLERYASATALVARLNELLPADHPRYTGAAQVLVAVQRGDAAARHVWDDAIDLLGHTLATYVKILAPEAIIIGGGLSHAQDSLLLPLQHATQAELTFADLPVFTCTRLGHRAGQLGIAMRAFETLGEDDVDFGRSATQILANLGHANHGTVAI